MAGRSPEHPNLPRRGLLALVFGGIAISGMLGGLIGWGLIASSCRDTPNVAQRLLEEVPGYRAHLATCDWKLLGAAVLGTIVAAVGAGVVATLMLRAQSEWRAHPPVSRTRSAGTPPRT